MEEEKKDNEVVEEKEIIQTGEKKTFSYGLIIGLIVAFAVIFVIGWQLGIKFANWEDKATNKEPEKTQEQEQTQIQVELTDVMKRFIEWEALEYADGSNALEKGSGERRLYIEFELGAITKDPPRDSDAFGQLGYIEYDTYKAKYDEIFGDNYDCEKDVKDGPSEDMCKSFISENSQNYVCWMILYGDIPKREGITHTITNRYQEGNMYYMEGKMAGPNGAIDNYSYTISYTIKGNKAYLKSVNITEG